MLAIFRNHLNAWYARLFFLLLVATFVLWGVGDVVRNLFAPSDALATVAGQKIDLPQLQEAYRRQLAQVTQMFGGKLDATPQMKQGIAGQAIEQVVTQTALNVATHDMGLGAGDAALRQSVLDIPNFRGPNGQFDRTTYDTVLRNNNMTEARLLDLLRADLDQRQLLEAAQAGVASPEILTRQVFAFQQEKRVADIVNLRFAAVPPPPEPGATQAMRWYDNHKERYATAEFRRIKAVVLSPETVGRDIQITDDELKAAFAQRKSEFEKPEKRSVQVLSAPDEAQATALAKQWQDGADWATVQTGHNPVELADAAKLEIPTPELADAVFAAPSGAVGAPVKGPFGWQVFKVTKITPGSDTSFAQAEPDLRRRLLADRAADLIDERAGKLGDALAAGTSLDDLPGDLGLAAVTGTLDAQGNTQSGTPAPIPGTPALRTALVAAAFAARKGDAPTLVQAPKDADGGDAYYAVVVEDIVPPTTRPFDEVSAQVTNDWKQDQIRHTQEEAAAKILAAIKGGQSLAAAAAPLQLVPLPPADRAGGAPGLPSQLLQPLFTLKVGEPTMVETADGFTVATLASIDPADPKSDPLGYGRIRDAMTKAVGDDIQALLVTALRTRAHPQIQQGAVAALVQSE